LEDPNSEFLKHGTRLFDITTFELIKFFFASGFPNFSRKLHLRQNPKEPSDFFLNTFLQTFEYREKNNVKRNDFVSMLLGLKDSFTPEELAAEGFLVYAGGFETSSTLITFACYEIARDMEIQQRLRDEIKSGLEENDGKLTYDMLFGFKYLDQVSQDFVNITA
jgi:cytochrome P450 family 6